MQTKRKQTVFSHKSIETNCKLHNTIHMTNQPTVHNPTRQATPFTIGVVNYLLMMQYLWISDLNESFLRQTIYKNYLSKQEYIIMIMKATDSITQVKTVRLLLRFEQAI